MGRNLEFNRDLRTMQISRYAHEFLTRYKYRGSEIEPFYRTLDRLISEYKNSEIYELQEQVKGLQHANEEYLKRIHNLENPEPKQTRLETC